MSLASKHPELIKEWNYEKNKDITPETTPIIPGLKIWWRCDKGHEWEAYVNNRIAGHGCPYCYEKNRDLTPDQVTVFSSKRVWWRCDKGHEWDACISRRANGSGCPYCHNDNKKKSVICVETEQIFDSISEAACTLYPDSPFAAHSGISKCLRGICNTYHGQHWKRIDSNN